MARKKSAPAKRSGKRRSVYKVMTAARRGKRRAKKGLSEIFTPSGFAAAGKNTAMGAVGGGVALVADRYVLSGQSMIVRVLGHLGLSIGAWALGQPSIGAGAAGGATVLLGQEMGMGESANWANQDALNQLPVFLDENGNAFALAEDGSQWYLDEAGTPFTLAEDGSAIYPTYGTQYAMNM